MNLLSLPNEMIVRILHYSSYNTRVTIRKINERIDSVTKAYFGTKLPVYSLSYPRIHFASDNRRLVMQIFKRPLQLRRVDNEYDYIEEFDDSVSVATVLESIFKKGIAINYILTLWLCEDRFDDDVIDVLYRNRQSLRCTKSLNITATFNCSLNKLEKLFECLNKLDTLEINRRNIDVFCNSKLLGNRKWRSLKLGCNKGSLAEHSHNGLNDQFLKEVVMNCKEFKIYCYCESSLQFTIPAILKAFQTAIEEGNNPDWCFYIQLKNMTLEEVKLLAERILNCKSELAIRGINGLVCRVYSSQRFSTLYIYSSE